MSVEWVYSYTTAIVIIVEYLNLNWFTKVVCLSSITVVATSIVFIVISIVVDSLMKVVSVYTVR